MQNNPTAKQPTYGIDFKGGDYDSNHSGLTLATSCKGKVRNGMCIVFTNETNKVNGIALAPLLNMIDTLNGIAVSGLVNGLVSSCVSPPALVNGVVISSLLSIVKTANGLIISPINAAQKINGMQLGVVNATRELHGVQFGLINYADNGFVKWFPIFNIAI